MQWNSMKNYLNGSRLRGPSISPSFLRKHVTALVNGKTYEMDMKFKANGEPYLVPRESMPQRPYSSVLYYIAYKDEPEILGSGSQISKEAQTYDVKEAFRLLASEGRNTLVRMVRKPNRKYATQCWNTEKHCWTEDGKKLPY